MHTNIKEKDIDRIIKKSIKNILSEAIQYRQASPQQKYTWMLERDLSAIQQKLERMERLSSKCAIGEDEQRMLNINHFSRESLALMDKYGLANHHIKM